MGVLPGIVTQANLLAFQQYEPQAYPGPVVLFRAEGRQVAPADEYRLAWREIITGELEISNAPGGDSGQMLIAPHVQVLAVQLKTCLRSCTGGDIPAEMSQRMSFWRFISSGLARTGRGSGR